MIAAILCATFGHDWCFRGPSGEMSGFQYFLFQCDRCARINISKQTPT